MKYLSRIGIVLLTVCLMLTACKNDDKEITGFSIDKEDITIDAEGGEDVLNVSSSSEWVAIASEPWLTISPANGIGSAQCKIRIDSTLVNDIRTASIRFAPTNQEAKIVSVHQMGYGKMIVPEKTEMEIENSANYSERYFEMKVTTNVAFKVEIENEDGKPWLSTDKFDVKLDRGSRPRTVKLKFNWKMNPDPEVRSTKVKFVPTDASVTLAKEAYLDVTQKAAPKIEDNRAGDSLALLTIADKLQASGYDTSESMIHWNEVELWSEGDDDLPCPDAVGRLRYVKFFVFNTKETLPQEVKYLKYAETLSFYGNTNTMYLNIDLGNDICNLKYLKNLQIAAYGLVSLPDEFVNLKQLEVLDLNSNNFSSIPEILTPQNFPNLKELNLSGMRRWLCMDLKNKNNSRYENGLGLYLNTAIEADAQGLKRLFLWDKLEYLSLTYNYIEGNMIDFEVGKDGVTGYTQADAEAMGLKDTIQYLYDASMSVPAGTPKGTTIPKILPNIKSLRVNFNYLTGKVPNWILYHPHLMDWIPETFIFSQQDRGIDSKGNLVGFSNEPKNFEYYYSVFDKYRKKYEIQEENEND